MTGLRWRVEIAVGDLKSWRAVVDSRRKTFTTARLISTLSKGTATQWRSLSSCEWAVLPFGTKLIKDFKRGALCGDASAMLMPNRTFNHRFRIVLCRMKNSFLLQSQCKKSK